MQTKHAVLLLTTGVVLNGFIFAQEAAPPTPEEASEAPKTENKWTDFSWLTKWFKKQDDGQKPASPDSPATAANDAGEQKKPAGISEWVNFSWVKDQWANAGQLTQEMKDKLSKVDLDALEKQYNATMEALQKRDYAEAQKFAAAMDATLGTEGLTKMIPLLKVRAEEGWAAMTATIQEYLANPQMSVAEKKLFEGLITGLETLQHNDVRGFLSLAIILVCEQKFRGHEGQLIGCIIVGILYGDESTRGLIQWSSDSLKQALKMKPTP